MNPAFSMNTHGYPEPIDGDGTWINRLVASRMRERQPMRDFSTRKSEGLDQ
jgi:hypothetical protein